MEAVSLRHGLLDGLREDVLAANAPRRGLAFLLFNILTWIVFGSVMYWLRGSEPCADQWTLCYVFSMVVRGVVPSLALFGFYRIWLATMQWWPNCFYAVDQDHVPQPFKVRDERKEVHRNPNEPTQDYLNLRPPPPGVGRNLIVGVIYVASILLAWL